MNNVNFWDETTTLYINDVPCAVRKGTILARGHRDNTIRFYRDPAADDGTRAILKKIFGLVYTTTIFTKKPYYTTNPFWDTTMVGLWESIAHGNKLFEKDIKKVYVEIEYALCDSKVSMKKLLDYPADLVVEYLKERGITSCPLSLEWKDASHETLD